MRVYYLWLFMGWGYQWTTDKHGRERNTDTDFSLTNYREVDNRLSEYRRIGSIVNQSLNICNIPI